MVYIILGVIAFGCLYIFDISKIYQKWGKWPNIFFGLGFLILALVTGLLIYRGWDNIRHFSWLFLLLSLLGGLFMLYALFFALPFKKTYVKGDNRKVVDTGVYSLCRHPGVLGFFVFYLGLWLALLTKELFGALIIWTLMDIIHVWVQDRFIFPKSLNNYRQYVCTTPFLIPTRQSWLNFWAELKRKRFRA